MNSTDRAEVLTLVRSAVVSGCVQAKACRVVGVDERTVQRWQRPDANAEDGRHGPLTEPHNKLSLAERSEILAIASSPEYCNKSPHQIVPSLADGGTFVASESSFYRVMKADGLLAHRGRTKPPVAAQSVPRAYEAKRPLELLSWDITYLLSSVRGQYFYLYLFLDIFSRKIVGQEVHENESMEYSSKLLEKICNDEKIEKNQLSVHADNGGPMKGATMLVTMQRLGVMPSFSRPSVSNDNPFSESMFKTLKYCPMYPNKPFATLEDARTWVTTFVDWYNNVHMHSAIKFTTPASRHAGLDQDILNKREIVYKSAQQKNPERWSGETRNWQRIDSVKLNWLKEKEMSAKSSEGRAAS